ncbi:riboflavin synthase [Gammaproteobacteria bacterium]|nr:riboflavin synthase [Gammaproteobacteria bacterium]
MFTGIIEATGEIESSQQTASGGSRLGVRSTALDFRDVKIGDSISISGVCLTVTALNENTFFADVSNETLKCTALAKLSKGDLVNLEKAMLINSRLGGHIVSGHVDGLAELISKKSDGASECLQYKVSPELAKYIAHKGSVCLDGVSLTVNEVSGMEFSVNIIPHTIAETTIRLYQPGRLVNLEVDVISRYLERLIKSDEELYGAGLTKELLDSAGFIKPPK